MLKRLISLVSPFSLCIKLCYPKVKEEKEDCPDVAEDEEMVDDPDEDFAISEGGETSEDIDEEDEDIDGPFNSLSQLADISLAAEGKLKDLALSEQIRWDSYLSG